MNKETNIAFIGLGSNLRNPKKQIEIALGHITANHNIILLKKSSLYETAPYGYTKQAMFINAVIKIATSLDCYELLAFLQQVELLQKRKRLIKWGPRTIDLDILAFNNLTINNNNLVIPHKDLKNREFVLMPWAEIEPQWQLPDGETINGLLDKLLTISSDIS